MATVGKKALTRAELDRLAASRLSKIKQEEYRIHRAVIDEWVVNTLLAEAASKRGLTIEQLIGQDVDAPVVEPTDVEARAVLESNPERFKEASGMEALEAARRELRQRRAVLRRHQYVQSLRSTANVSVVFDRPRARIAANDRPFKGPASSPVTLTIFSDFGCQFCARMNPVLEQVLTRYPKDVRVVFKHFPLGNRAGSTKAAESAICAAEQGRFWQMHDILYANQGRVSTEDLARHAVAAGLDLSRFHKCLARPSIAAKWQEDKQEGEKLGVAGTPVTFVNGILLQGHVSFEQLARAIDEELSVQRGISSKAR